MQANSNRCQRLCASVGLIVGLLAYWPASAQAVTLIPESNFEGSGPEADGWRYTASYCTASPCPYLDVSTDVAHTGSKSLKLTYRAAWSKPNPQINTVGIYKDFPAQSEAYIRYWVFTTGFTYSTPGTKGIYWKGTPGIPNGTSIHWNGSREPGWGGQVWADVNYGSVNFLPNTGNHKVMANDTWYCVEEHVKLNTPGIADGVVEVWVDGLQTLHFPGRTMRGTAVNGPGGNSSNMVWTTFEIYKQDGDGIMYIDQFMAATTRIGCGPAGGDTTPPDRPTNLTVSQLREWLHSAWMVASQWLASADAMAADR